MTYYELVKRIYDLCDSPRNEQNIKELTNIKLEKTLRVYTLPNTKKILTMHPLRK